MQFTQAEIERFYSNVDVRGPDECWPWMGSCDRQGYGQVGFRSTKFRAHRVAFMIKNGDLETNVLVLHSCDNPPCCNDAHLKVGTDQDNMEQMSMRQRGRNQWS